MANTNKKLRTMVELALLMAVVLLMAYTPLGYLKVGAMSITFIGIPVAVGAIVLGPAAGSFLGLIFGLTSFGQCFGADAFGVALMAISPVKIFIMCVVPRVLMGAGAGWIFRGISKIDKTKVVSYAIASLCTALLNTLLFTSALMLLFGNTEVVMNLRGESQIIPFIIGFIGVNGVVEAISCGVLGGAISKALAVFVNKK